MVAAVLVAGAMVAGCEMGVSCTLIGCADGVDIVWSGASSRDRGTLTIDGVSVSFDCATAGSTNGVFCNPNGLRLGRTPTDLRVEVVTPSGTRSGTFVVSYTTSRPNGPSCEPVCRSATVTVP